MLSHSYDPFFVAASVIVAMTASFAALDFAGRVRGFTGTIRLTWLAIGATVMGLGIWSMHFVGMIAFQLPTEVRYDLPLMVLSAIVAIAASLLAMIAVNHPRFGASTVLGAGILMGGAIAGMHYIGMASMQVNAALHYSRPIVTLSVIIAIVASFAALWLQFRFRHDRTQRGKLLKAASAMVMGVAIAGMHYTGMAAAGFTPHPVHAAPEGALLATNGLGIAVAIGAMGITILALIGAVVDRNIQAQRAFTEQLRQSEERTRTIIDTSLDAVISMDSSGAITDWNAQAERMFGWTQTEAVGRRLADTVIPPQYREAHEAGLRRFMETGEGPVLNRRIEITGLTRDGVEFPIELAIAPAKVGGQWRFSAFIRDLTEQKRAAEALRIGEARYRDLFENIPIGLYRSSPDGRMLDANLAMVAMLGYPSREALLATSASALYADPADRRRWIAAMEKGDAVRDFDVRLRRADGSVIWARDTTRIKRDADGKILLHEGVLEDITESVEAHNRLEASERRLVQILETVPLGIFVTDDKGNPMFVNAAAKRLMGAEALGGRVDQQRPRHLQLYRAGTDELYPADRIPVMLALHGQASSVDDMEIQRGEQRISLSVQGAPIVDADNHVVGAIAAFMDTTERRSLEAQLRQALKMEAVGQLAGGVAHDFNNLLTVIMSYGSLLLEELGPDDRNRGDVQEIVGAADRATRLTRQLLAFSRKQVMQPQEIDIDSIIADLENMLRRVIGENIELVTSLNAAGASVVADPGNLEQVLMNLVVNARDAMPSGGRLTISTSTAESDVLSSDAGRSEGGFVRLTVSDTGVGMQPEVQRRAFDPFFTTKEQGRGTGLGLSTVYGIVKQSGGEIRVDSAIGRGSTFEILFPILASECEAQKSSKPEEGLPGGTETLLLVEDDFKLRALAERVLKSCGYTVLSAPDGREALEIATRDVSAIDAVVTDVVMPGMSGRELVERLLVLRPDLAYLMMSGYTDDDLVKQAALHGDMPFLQKPFTPEQLTQKVRSILDRGGMAARRRPANA